MWRAHWDQLIAETRKYKDGLHLLDEDLEDEWADLDGERQRATWMIGTAIHVASRWP